MLFHILAPMYFMVCWVFELINRGKKMSLLEVWRVEYDETSNEYAK